MYLHTYIHIYAYVCMHMCVGTYMYTCEGFLICFPCSIYSLMKVISKVTFFSEAPLAICLKFYPLHPNIYSFTSLCFSPLAAITNYFAIYFTYFCCYFNILFLPRVVSAVNAEIMICFVWFCIISSRHVPGTRIIF